MSKPIVIATGVAVTWLGALAVNLLWLRQPAGTRVWVVVVANLAAGLATVVGLTTGAVAALRRGREADLPADPHSRVRSAISLGAAVIIGEAIVLGIDGVRHPEYLLAVAVIVPLTWAYVRPMMRAIVSNRRGGA